MVMICQSAKAAELLLGFLTWHPCVFAQMAVACTAMPLNMAAFKCSELSGQG